MSAVGAGAFTDGSGTITTGGTSQQARPQNLGRQFLFIQNVSTADLWVNFGVAAVQNQPSIKLTPNSAVEFSLGASGLVPTASVNIVGATTGQAYVVKEA